MRVFIRQIIQIICTPEMGNNPNQPEHPHPLPQTLTIKHPRLSQAKYLPSPDPSQGGYLQLSQPVQSQEVYQKWRQSVHAYQVQPTEIETILLPKLMDYEAGGICGSSGVVKCRYAVVPYVLSEEIVNRSLIKQPFLEKELWYLLYILAMAGSTAHSRGLQLGDVRPENVLMSEDGEICVGCLSTFLDEQTNYTKTLVTKTKTYLAPEQVRQLQQGKQACTEDVSICESFSIGLCALAAAMLRDQSGLYTEGYGFDGQGMQKELLALRNNNMYSLMLKKVIESMLAQQAQSRLTCLQAIQLLKPYQDSIVNLQEFSINQFNIPAELKPKLGQSPQTPRTAELNKVINSSDFNTKSRMLYSQAHQPQPAIRLPPPQVHGQVPAKFVESGFTPYSVNGHNVRVERVERTGESRVVEVVVQDQMSGLRPMSAVHEGSWLGPGEAGFKSPQVLSYIRSAVRPVYHGQALIAENSSPHPPAQQIIIENRPIHPQQQPHYTFIQPPTHFAPPSAPQNKVQAPFSVRLADYGRETNSIRPPADRDNRFETYQETIKKIDEKLTQSKRMFPEDQ